MSATLFAAQVDFTYAGDLKVFVDEEQVKAIEQRMAERGYLEGKSMVTVFNMLRSNDLIWPYVINNYLKGKAPFPVRPAVLEFRRHAAAGRQSFVLSAQLLSRQQTRRKGKMMIGDTPIDLKSIKVPIYNLATREDHIAPAKSVLLGSKFFGGPVRFVLSGSGHIAGVVNPPDKKKYQYWTGPQAAQRQPRRAGSPRRRNIPARGGRTGSPGSRPGPDRSPRPRPRRRQAQADRGRAGKLRESAGLTAPARDGRRMLQAARLLYDHGH